MIKKRKLSQKGLEVSALGLGVMMMPNFEDSVQTIRGAMDLGVTLLDTADIFSRVSSTKRTLEMLQGFFM